MTEVRWAEPGDAAAVAARIAAELAQSGPKRLAFTGGSTPLNVFALLADQPLDWSGVTIALTDDRRVPDDHPASNFGKLHAALAGTGAKFERLEEGAKVAPFDLVWLGMGEDGHIASLFPHMQALIRPGPSVIATTPIPLPPEAPFERLTLNKRALKATRGDHSRRHRRVQEGADRACSRRLRRLSGVRYPARLRARPSRSTGSE